jgi:hypothetical protein
MLQLHTKLDTFRIRISLKTEYCNRKHLVLYSGKYIMYHLNNTIITNLQLNNPFLKS